MTPRLRSPLAMLRARDEAEAATRAASLAGRDGTVDDRFAALWRAGVRDVHVEGCPTPGNHGRLILTFTDPLGRTDTVEASTYAVILDRAERATQRALRSR